MKAFVTDGDQRPALAITRSLGQRGVSVLVGEETPGSLASASRYCTRHVTYPSPRRHPEAFDQFLMDFVRREKIDVILPVTDITTYAIARNQEQLRRRCALAVPPFDAFERVTNKAALVQSAPKTGMLVPRTVFVDGIAQLKEVADLLDYPVVVKPNRSRIPTDAGWVPAMVHYAQSAGELWQLYREIEYLSFYPTLIQQRIVGPGQGLFVLFDRGRLLTAFAHRRLREKPPSGGASVLSESIRVDPWLKDAAVRLLAPLGWHGVAMLEYKQDCRTGELFLMEVNGRFWGSLQLAVDAGVDFPHLTFQLALGQRPDVPASYKLGVRSRWLLGDVDHLLLRLRNSDRALNLPETAPSRLRTVMEFLKFAQTELHYETFTRSDLRPFVHELSSYAGDLWTSSTQRLRRALVRTAVGCAGVARTPIPK